VNEKIRVRILALLLFAVIHAISIRSFSKEIQNESLPNCHFAAREPAMLSISSLAEKVKALVAENRCKILSLPCEVVTEHLSSRAFAKHQIVVADVARFGISTTSDVIEGLRKLQEVGICSVD